ncbi:hypothetical protein M758_3G239900 [Ceratodon purpureus]|nr:hypothetical protein M758_3G239900 [Ceratodon purpureus]
MQLTLSHCMLLKVHHRARVSQQYLMKIIPKLIIAKWLKPELLRNGKTRILQSEWTMKFFHPLYRISDVVTGEGFKHFLNNQMNETEEKPKKPQKVKREQNQQASFC